MGPARVFVETRLPKLELQTNLLTYSALSNGCEAAGKPFVAFELLQ